MLETTGLHPSSSSAGFSSFDAVASETGLAAVTSFPTDDSETGESSISKLRSLPPDVSVPEDESEAVEKSSYRGVEESSRFERLVYRALASDMISCSKAAVLLDEPMEEVKNKLELV